MSSIAAISLRSINRNLTRHCYARSIRTFSTNATSGDSVDDNESKNTNESNFDSEWRMFEGLSENYGSINDPFLKKLEQLEKARNSGLGYRFNQGDDSNGLDDSSERNDPWADEMGKELKKISLVFYDHDADEVENSGEEFSFGPDMEFNRGGTYTTKDLDLRKPGVTNFRKRNEFKVTTEEVLKMADFRNVRFLANFITEAGIIHKRSTMGIRAKAQRKIAREIKTARAFGLMPFTTMGTKPFAFGRSMENLEDDFTYRTFDSFNVEDENVDGDRASDDLGDGDKDRNGPAART